MERCTRCIMPRSTHGITFDEQGVCSLCQSYQPAELYGEEAFVEVLNSARARNGRYDCIVPLSGGRDSTYVLYLTRAVHNLKTLAVNYDNEFRNPQAVVNMERACKKLGADFVSIRSRRDIGHKFLKANVRAGIPLGLPTLVGSFCRQCAYGYTAITFLQAEKFDVPLILWGTSKAESTMVTRQNALAKIQASRYRKLMDPNLYKAEYYALLERLEFRVRGNSLLDRSGPPTLHSDRTREISVFDYIPWDRRKIKDTIMKELGWEKPADHATSWRMDCVLHEVVNYCWIKLIGASMDCMGYCNMINAGQMERAEALSQEEYMIEHCGDHLEEILVQMVGLSPRDLDLIRSLGDKSTPYLRTDRQAASV
jgi:hypothetical protein